MVTENTRERKNVDNMGRIRSYTVSKMLLGSNQVILLSGHWISNALAILIKIKDNQRSPIKYTPWLGAYGSGSTLFLLSFLTTYTSVITLFVLYGHQSSHSIWIWWKGNPRQVLTESYDFDVGWDDAIPVSPRSST